MTAFDVDPTPRGPAATAVATPPDRVVIFDTTLRDGEQSPGCSMNVEEKLRVADVLEGMGVDVIEAGFPIASEGDFQAVQAIAKRVRESVVCGLARAAPATSTAPRGARAAERPRIHTFIGTSPLHRKYQLGLDAEQVHERVVESVTRRRRYTDDVEWSGMDASRTEPDFLFRCIESAISAGATTINIPDTVGYAYPEEFADLIREIRNNVPEHRPGGDLGPLPQRPRPRGRPTPCARSRPGARRSSAPSTASASGPATARWRRWSWRCTCAPTACPTGPAWSPRRS
jgi:2-isopropylmalate synthase